MNECNEITVDGFDAMIGEENVLVIDLRDELTFRCGHIPGAINLQADQLNMFLSNANKELVMVLCSDTGSECGECASLFTEFGFEQCFCLAGGYEQWVAKQLKTSDGSQGLCRWLDSHGYSCEDIDRKGFNGETALMLAARQGYTEYVVDIIDRGADIEARNNDGNSAVWLACFGNNEHILEELIRAGADLDVQNDNGASPLIYAASAGRQKMVTMLLNAGADASLQTLDGFSALDVASTYPILKAIRAQTAVAVAS